MKENFLDMSIYEKVIEDKYLFWKIPKNLKGGFGHNCFVVGFFGGHFCGYIELEKDSVYYGKDYFSKEIISLDVHGGITFCSDKLRYTNSKNNWYLGFDCNHWCDQLDPKGPEYVCGELHKLSRQIYLADELVKRSLGSPIGS